MDNNDEVTLRDLLYFLTNGWKILLVSVLLCFLLALGYTYYKDTYDIYYETNASMVINSKTYSIVDGKVEITAPNNVALAKNMVNTYRLILTSDNVLDKVKYDLGIDEPTKHIRAGLTVSSPKDTEVIMVTVKNKDPRLAADIANSIMRVAPEVIAETVEVGSINVLDRAKVPTVPLPTNRALNLAIGAASGLMLGIVIILMLGFLRPKVKSKIDLKEQLDLNCLGEIPHIKNKERRKRHKQQPKVTAGRINNSFIEGYKTLAEMVIHVSEQANNKSLMITSAFPEEGKTNVSVNLALSMASAGKKTLLIDFDSYRYDLIDLMELEPDTFLIDILNGDIPYKKAVIEDTDTGLHLIITEKGEPLNINLLNSSKLKEVFADLKNEYDYIIADTPPVLIQSEALSLLKYVDNVLLVVRQEKATIMDIENAKDKILDAGAEIMGCVLNDIRYLIGTEYSNKYGYYGKRYYGNKAKHHKKSSRKSTFKGSRINKDDSQSMDA